MLPNSVTFINNELKNVLNNDGKDFWVINCSNVKPHVYYLDAVRKIWQGQLISDETHSEEFSSIYFDGDNHVANCLKLYPDSMIKFGQHDDEHAGEQFYTENVRTFAHHFIRQEFGNIKSLNCLINDDFYEQAKYFTSLCESKISDLKSYLTLCQKTTEKLANEVKVRFENSILLQAKIHYYCANGVIKFGQSLQNIRENKLKEAFVLAGDAAKEFDLASGSLKDAEIGIWHEFYANECLADIKYSAYMIRKMRGTIRELGDGARHEKWYRDTMYAPEDRNVMLLLVIDNHMTDEELYEAMKEKDKTKIQKCC